MPQTRRLAGTTALCDAISHGPHQFRRSKAARFRAPEIDLTRNGSGEESSLTEQTAQRSHYVMKTKAYCPTCESSFSFWRVVFAYSPFGLYCRSCGWRIVIGRDRENMWGMYGTFGVITLVLVHFIIARDPSRFAVLGVLWILSFALIEIIGGLLIVNLAHFSTPEKSAEHDDIVDD